MRSRIPVSGIAFAVCMFILASDSIAAGDYISVSELYPKEKLENLLSFRTQWRPLPKADDDKLEQIWGPGLNRILLKAKFPTKRDTWILQFSK